MSNSQPWQLRMFEKTLKKKLRLKEFRKYLKSVPPSQECLLVTCGDNNGAINYHLRELGGRWSWADMENTTLQEMSELLGDPVAAASNDHLPFPDNHFDLAIAIDVHEHLPSPEVFTAELKRICKNQGRILITVPGGDNRKLVNILKNNVGMTKEKYGHYRDGLSITELNNLMNAAGITPSRASTFSRFFTEMIELSINFLYVKVLAKKSNATVEEGTIAPQTKDQLKSVEKTYRLYSLVYPFFWTISQLDKLLFFNEGYVVVVEGIKEN